MTCKTCDGRGTVAPLQHDGWTPCPDCTAKPAPDIVERLRLAKFPVRIRAGLVAEAAAEITRLRAEVERLRAAVEGETLRFDAEYFSDGIGQWLPHSSGHTERESAVSDLSAMKSRGCKTRLVRHVVEDLP